MLVNKKLKGQLAITGNLNTTDYDTVIIGGGPAGCATACRLALFGYSVCLIERSDSSRPRAKVGASLSSRILDLLADIQADELLVNAGFPRTLGASVLWGEEVETRPSHGIPGFGVERGRFDELLLAHARTLGVTVIRPATVVGVGNNGGRGTEIGIRESGVREGGIRETEGGIRGTEDGVRETESGVRETESGVRETESGVREKRAEDDSRDDQNTWCVSVNNESGLSKISCRFVVDASGRRRYSQHKTSSAYQKHFDTVALYAYWKSNMDPRNGVVEASDSAWCWASFVEPGLLIAAVFVDRQRLNTTSPEKLYQTILSESVQLKSVLTGEQQSSVSVCDASICLADSAGENGLLRVGDALLAKDPISAQGVESAIASGLSAARVIRTALQNPEDQLMAWEFYQQQHRQKSVDHLQFTSRFYEERFNVCNTHFWKSRVIQAEAQNETQKEIDNNRSIDDKTPQMFQVSKGVLFKNVAAIQRDVVAPVAGIELSDGERIAFWEGEILADLLHPFNSGKIVLEEGLQYWRSHFPNIHGVRLLRWCLDKNILV